MNIRAATQTTHLGRYHVVKRLAAGGMADVLLARTNGIAGFERHVVIKRIHAGLLEEPRYVKMFLDEARLAASLHHHNIVQVNDIGEEAGEYFFTMEYVHGEDARTLLVEASKREQQIPLEHVVTIVMAAAAGLHHAHEQRGMDGAPLHIVHRDVSPANILIGYDGAVKVADFGIAMAAHRAEHTQSGVLKGKVAYMSPEQCNCEPVDRRSDVFSLGIVLYELATVRPCFAGDNDFMTMSAIVSGKLALPSDHRKDLPPELEAIILKALARAPGDRYQSADELRLALEQYAANAKLRTSSTALADYMKTQFGAKALPWQEDDGEPEMQVVEPRPERTPKPTLPLRPSQPALSKRAANDAVPVRSMQDALVIPGAGDADEDLSIPLASPEELARAVAEPAALQDSPLRPTLPMRAVDRRPVKESVAGDTAVRAAARAAETASERAPTTAYIPESAAEVPPTAHRGRLFLAMHQRKLWLAGAVAAVVIAALSLILVSTGGSKPSPRASAAPRSHASERAVAPEPLERPTVAPAAAPAPATDTSEPAAKKPARKVKKEPAKSPTKKWDPDALFPQ